MGFNSEFINSTVIVDVVIECKLAEDIWKTTELTICLMWIQDLFEFEENA